MCAKWNVLSHPPSSDMKVTGARGYPQACTCTDTPTEGTLSHTKWHVRNNVPINRLRFQTPFVQSTSARACNSFATQFSLATSPQVSESKFQVPQSHHHPLPTPLTSADTLSLRFHLNSPTRPASLSCIVEQGLGTATTSVTNPPPFSSSISIRFIPFSHFLVFYPVTRFPLSRASTDNDRITITHTIYSRPTEFPDHNTPFHPRE
ncbi:hypothetical protein F5X96DRAFT_78859 [Biscogniauxia mediterranea]|nr:hypothetical protein F5X96DRAFT_78859 [Biscogniauxia mediterranea]